MNYLSYNIAFVSLSMCPIISSAQDKPNIVVLFADDISAREFPIYGSSVWSKPEGGNTSEPEFRADTPVMEQIAREGCWIKNCWAATVSMPSRAQMMTGRYAHVQKWWHNKDLGTYCNEKGKEETWPDMLLFGQEKLKCLIRKILKSMVLMKDVTLRAGQMQFLLIRILP